MRRFLRAFAGCWLVCQIVAAAAPLTLVSDNFGIDQASCCPGIGPGQYCPMHHKSGAERAGDKRTCTMESACAHHDAALLTILAVGVLPPAPIAAVSMSDTESLRAIASSTRAQAFVPDAPPPRI
jgi:hypothetical protein